MVRVLGIKQARCATKKVMSIKDSSQHLGFKRKVVSHMLAFSSPLEFESRQMASESHSKF